MVTIEWPCLNHPDKETQLWCDKCGIKFCRDCLTEDNEKYYCANCMQKKESKTTLISRIRADLGKPRTWVSILGGGLFGFTIIQVVTLILLASDQTQSLTALIGIIVALALASTFFGGIIAGLIDKEDAVIRGVQAAIIALAINATVNLTLGLTAVIPGFFSISIIVITGIIFMIFIPISFGAIGGKLGGLMRSRRQRVG
jgi:hypothetical protein